MKRKKLEWMLDELEPFCAPDVTLEQYVTPSEIAAGILCDIEDDLHDKFVADLGCGTGVLAIGAALQGAAQCVGFEISSGALKVFSKNVANAGVSGISLVQCDVLGASVLERFTNSFDTVLMNPPFGTKNNAGMDLCFLQTACKLSRKNVYSLHKTSTREFVLKKAGALEDGAWSAKVVAELRYDLPKSYRFHRQRSVDIHVDLVRLTRRDDNQR